MLFQNPIHTATILPVPPLYKTQARGFQSSSTTCPHRSAKKVITYVKSGFIMKEGVRGLCLHSLAPHYRCSGGMRGLKRTFWRVKLHGAARSQLADFAFCVLPKQIYLLELTPVATQPLDWPIWQWGSGWWVTECVHMAVGLHTSPLGPAAAPRSPTNSGWTHTQRVVLTSVQTNGDP